MRCYDINLPYKVSSSLVEDKALSADKLSAYVIKPILKK